MRVIAGSRKKTRLETVEGMGTRPTTDRIKETLFNMIASDVVDCRFLDLFAGSGQMGIEALSRGAAYACFVEKDKRAIGCIKRNLDRTKLEDIAEVCSLDITKGLSALDEGEGYHIIFMDPPYRKGLEKAALGYIQTSTLLLPDGYIILEADIAEDLSFVEELGYIITKQKQYKTNQHVFLIKGE